MRDTEAVIQRTLRMDYETFTNASFFLQGHADQFAQQRPGDRKRILSSILGLEIWEIYRERAAVRRKRHESETAAIDGQLEEINGELAQEDERRARLKELEENLAQLAELRKVKDAALENLRRMAASLAEQKRLVDMMANQLQAARARLKISEGEQADRQEELDRLRARAAEGEQAEQAYQAWQAARQELERWEGVAVNFRHHQERRAGPLLEIEKTRSSLEQEQRAALDQARQAAVLDAQLPALQADLASAQEISAGIHARLEKLPQLQQELETWQDQRGQARAENDRLKVEMAELKERIERLKVSSGATCPLCGQPLSPEDRLRLIAELEAQGRERGDRFRANQTLLVNSDQKRAAVEAETAALRALEQNELRYQERKAAGLEERLEQMRAALVGWQSRRGAAPAGTGSDLTGGRFCPGGAGRAGRGGRGPQGTGLRCRCPRQRAPGRTGRAGCRGAAAPGGGCPRRDRSAGARAGPPGPAACRGPGRSRPPGGRLAPGRGPVPGRRRGPARPGSDRTRAVCYRRAGKPAAHAGRRGRPAGGSARRYSSSARPISMSGVKASRAWWRASGSSNGLFPRTGCLRC